MKHHTALMVVLAVLLLTACKPKPTEPPQPKTDKPFPWQATLTTAPEKPQMNKPVTFRLMITDRQGKAVTGAQVQGSLVMPLMDMGKNEFAFADKGRGAYEGTGKVAMSGPWELVITAKAGSVEGQKTFPLAVGD